MKKTLCFLIFPAVFIITRLPLVKEPEQLVSFGLFILLGYVISLPFYFIMNKMRFDPLRSVIAALILSAADQLLKIAVYISDIRVKLIGDFLRIQPTENLNQTAMFNFLGLELDGGFVIIFKIVIILVLLLIFIKIKNKSPYLWHAFILLLAAGLSNLADSVFWGYTLDYVYFYRLTCYDLKDFYVDTAIGFVLMEIILFYSKKSRAGR